MGAQSDLLGVGSSVLGLAGATVKASGLDKKMAAKARMNVKQKVDAISENRQIATAARVGKIGGVK